MIGLAEMMNFPGVIAGDPGELEKLALEGAEHVDGHAPGVLGKALNAYAASGIRSDHEALTVEEGRERLRAGMWLLIREASMARNLVDLLPLVEEYGTTHMAFCTDDRDPEDIADSGHINEMVRKAVAAGIAPEDAVVLASINPATWHRLDHLGAIAPGYQADLLVLPDLESFDPELVLKAGRPVDEIPEAEVPDWVKHTVRVPPISPATSHSVDDGGSIPRDRARARTRWLRSRFTSTGRRSRAASRSPRTRRSDLAKIAVVERHLATGRVGLGFVEQLGASHAERSPRRWRTTRTRGRARRLQQRHGWRAVQRVVELSGGIVAVETTAGSWPSAPCRSPACSRSHPSRR